MGTREHFTYHECPSCGCVQIASVPENLGVYYPSNYYSLSDRGWQPGGGAAAKAALKLARIFGPGSAITRSLVKRSQTFRELSAWFAPTSAGFSARVLDVGSGAGATLLKLKAFGFRRLTGIDPFIERDLDLGDGVRVLKQTVHEHQGAYDVIMAHHSFEHMPDPEEALRSIARLLAPGGVVLLRIPVAQCEAWKRYGANWVQLDAPRHLFLHTPRSMELLASRAGLRVRDARYDSHAFQFWASELYARDLALTDEATGQRRDPRTYFSDEEMAHWAAEAERLNAEGRGDQAIFYLEATR